MNNSSVIKLWVSDQVEDSAMVQLNNLSTLPFIYKHIAVMPDVHAGLGSTIGSVIPTYGAIIPAAVGVDLGCGMMAVRSSLVASDLPDNLHPLRCEIEKAVPHGRTDHGGRNDRGAWGHVPGDYVNVYKFLLEDNYKKIEELHPKAISKNVYRHMGTLGTGNHFIEICLDEEERVWIMLHSGSRGAGNRIGSYFIELAKEEMRRYFINLPDVNLAYLPEGSKYFNDYMFAVGWAQMYARFNREWMMKAVKQVMDKSISKRIEWSEEAINCHHNYVDQERHFGKDVWITRKGAVSAQEGQLGIIPGSMGTKSYIVSGKGNRDSFCSCSHGAGRRMSRTEARKRFTLEQHADATKGIECRKDIDVIDETPAAYKDIDKVMEAQKDLVDIKHTLKQIICVKG